MFTPDIKAAEAAFATFMECLGLDLTDESLQNTPKRVAKMFINETCEGLFTEPPKMTSFPNDKDYHGMIVLRDLKEVMMRVLDDQFDHGAVFYEQDPYKQDLQSMIHLGDQNPEKLHFVPFMPTAENLAMFWFGLLDEALANKGIRLAHVKVWETPTSTALATHPLPSLFF